MMSILIPFTGLHLYLTVKGKTSLEICAKDSRYTPSDSIKTNLKIVYGTSNVFGCFLPRIDILPYLGDHW